MVEAKFGADDFRSAMTKMLALRQIGTIEEYTAEFQSLQFDITMHNFHYDDMFFASIYITGLKEENQGAVEASLPNTVDRVTPRYNRRFWIEVTTTQTTLEGQEAQGLHES